MHKNRGTQLGRRLEHGKKRGVVQILAVDTRADLYPRQRSSLVKRSSSFTASPASCIGNVPSPMNLLG